MKKLILLAISSLSLTVFTAHADVAWRTALIEQLNAESASSTGQENIVYVKQIGAWSLTTNCDAQYAYYNRLDNPHFTAILLAAKIAEKPVRVVIETSWPRINGNCQIKGVILD